MLPVPTPKEAYANWYSNFVRLGLCASCRSAENKGRMTSHARNNREIGLFDDSISCGISVYSGTIANVGLVGVVFI